MSSRAQHSILAHIRLQRKDDLLLAHADFRIGGAQLARAHVARIQVPRMADCGGRCGLETGVVRPLSAFVTVEGGQEQKQTFWYSVALASCTGTLRRDIFIERHLSRIFPASPRSLASVLIPRPAARRGLLRPCGRPTGFGFQKIFSAIPQRTRNEKIFRTFRKSAAWHLGAGHLASLRARVSRGQPGQIQTGEK
jgi:hypothetical protein